MTYSISIVDTARTDTGVRIASVAGTDNTGRSFRATFDVERGGDTPTAIHALPDIPQAEGGPAVPGWRTFEKTLTGDGDYLCEPPFPVDDLRSGLIFEGLSDWLRQNLY